MSTTLRSVLGAAAVFLSVALAARAQAAKPLEASDVTSVTATVEAIDTANRVVTLKGPEGKLVNIRVPEEVKRFNEIKVGDRVTARYSRAALVEVKKPGEAVPESKTKQAIVRKPGEKPAATATMETTVTVTVESIDAATPSLTVKTEKGNTLSFRVKDKKNIEGLKPGDKIVVTYTEALMVEVSTPKKSS